MNEGNGWLQCCGAPDEQDDPKWTNPWWPREPSAQQCSYIFVDCCAAVDCASDCQALTPNSAEVTPYLVLPWKPIRMQCAPISRSTLLVNFTRFLECSCYSLVCAHEVEHSVTRSAARMSWQSLTGFCNNTSTVLLHSVNRARVMSSTARTILNDKQAGLLSMKTTSRRIEQAMVSKQLL